MVEILAADAGIKLRQSRWFRDICDACGREFDHPVAARIGDAVKISLSEKPAYKLNIGSAQLNCSNRCV